MICWHMLLAASFSTNSTNEMRAACLRIINEFFAA
jgi:hypothetical protein